MEETVLVTERILCLNLNFPSRVPIDIKERNKPSGRGKKKRRQLQLYKLKLFLVLGKKKIKSILPLDKLSEKRIKQSFILIIR